MTTDNHPTQTADSGPDKVLAALADLGQATASEIAHRGQLGYSTVTARLRKLAESGQVERQQSADTGPTSWRLAGRAARPTTPAEPAPGQREPQEPEPQEPEPAVTDPPEDSHTTSPDSPPAPAADHDGGSGDRGGDEATQPPAAPAVGDAAPTGGAQAPRRAPGQLRKEVLGVLQTHAEESFTPHRISMLLDGASPGAIVGACRTLVAEGSARQVLERPATFQAE